MSVTREEIRQALDACQEMRESLGKHEGEAQSIVVGSVTRLVAISVTAIMGALDRNEEDLPKFIESYAKLIRGEVTTILAMLAAFERMKIPDTIEVARLDPLEKFYNNALTKVLTTVGFR